MNVWQHAWLPAAAFAGFFATQSAKSYGMIRDTVKNVDQNHGAFRLRFIGAVNDSITSCTRILSSSSWFTISVAGIEHDHPSNNRQLQLVAGWGAGLAGGLVTFDIFRRMLYSILLSDKPNPAKLFDIISGGEFSGKLGWKDAWRDLGPTATKASWNRVIGTHGGRFMCIVMAASVAVQIAPIAHAKAEGWFSYRNPDPVAWGRARREKGAKDTAEKEAVQQSKAKDSVAVDEEAMADRGADTGSASGAVEGGEETYSSSTPARPSPAASALKGG